MNSKNIDNVIRIGIMGIPVTSGNRGVMALGASLASLCADYGDFFLLIGNKEKCKIPFRYNGGFHQIEVVNCRMSPKSQIFEHLGWISFASLLYRLIRLRNFRQAICNITPWVAAIDKSAFVGDIRGGDSFSDIYGLKRLFHGFLLAWTVLSVKGNMVQFPQTYGPFESHIARRMARFLLNKSSIVIARDELSRKTAKELMLSDREVLLCPDVAFALEPIKTEHVVTDPPIRSAQIYGSIGININGLMYNGGYTRKNMFRLKLNYAMFLKELICNLSADFSKEILFVPHTYAPDGNVESDNEACRNVRASLPINLQSRVRIVNEEYDAHELKGIIGMCDFFIGSRMHSCIAALSQGIPCVGVAYSRKFEGVFDTVGMADWVVDARHVENDEAVERVLELYKRRDEVRDDLKMAAEDAQKRLKEVFQRLFAQFT